MKFTRLDGPVANVEGLDRFPRLGKIRLGLKKQSAKTGKEYPVEVDHFVVSPEVGAIFGNEPKELRGMFHSNNPEEVYQEKLAMYGQSTGLKCHGNGTVALRRNEKGDFVERTCPCEFLKTKDNPSGPCTAQAHLMVMLPEVPRGLLGYYQITTHSIYARGGILGSLKHMMTLVGRIGFVPIRLWREPQEITHDGKKKVHHILKFEPALTGQQIMDMRAKPVDPSTLLPLYEMEQPADENPLLDPVDEVEVEAEDLANADDAELAEVQRKLNEANQKKTEMQKAEAPKKPTKPAQGDGLVANRGGTPNPSPVSQDAPAPKPTNGNGNGAKAIPYGAWSDMVAFMDSHPDYALQKDEWKGANKVENVLKLNAAGQQALLTHMRAQVEGFPY